MEKKELQGPPVYSWVVWWLALFGLYLLFAAKLTGAEAAVGALAATLGTTAAVATSYVGGLRFRPRPSWLRPLGRVPAHVLADCAILGVALWRRLARGRAVEGQFRIVPFAPGGDDAESAARRALVTVGVCLAPNTVLVAVDRERGLLLIHQLVSTAEPPGGGDREWPL